MIPYFLLLIIPMFVIVFQTFQYNNNKSLVKAVNAKKYNIVMAVFFVWLLLLLVCRDETIGRDLPNYKTIFQEYTKGGLSYVFHSWSECLFRLYNWMIYRITDNYQFYLAITAIVTILPIAFLYMQNKQHSYLMIVLFVNMSTFIMLFSGLRQSLAISVGVLAYDCVKNKKRIKFVLWSIIASLIHHSGFMVFLLCPLYYFRIKENRFIFFMSVVLIVLIFNRQIFALFLSAFMSISEKYDTELTTTSAYGSLILFVLFSIFSYVITDEKNCDDETLGVRNYLLFSVIIQCFAPLHSLAMRMNYYFIIFIPYILSKCLTYPKKNMQSIAELGKVAICVFFTFLFVFSTYQSYVTGISTLDTIPYKTFWSFG